MTVTKNSALLDPYGGASQNLGTTASPTFADVLLTPPGAIRNASETGTFIGFRAGGSATNGKIGIGIASTGNHFEFNASVGFVIIAARAVSWRSGNADGDAADTGLSRISAGVVGVGTGAAGSAVGTIKAAQLSSPTGTTLNVSGTGTDNLALGYLGTGLIGSGVQHKFYANSAIAVESGNAAQWVFGQASELLTLSTSGTTTDTTANLLPANAIIESVVARVTTAITTATSWQLGDPTTAGRFTAANSTMAAGTTDIGLVHIDQAAAAGPRQTAAAKVRVTTVGTPGAGAIRITVFYRQFVAPTS